METQKRNIMVIFTVLAVTLFLLSAGCKKKDDPQPDPLPGNYLHTRIINGKVQFPSGSGIDYNKLKVCSAGESSINSDGTFQVPVFDNYFDYVDVYDDQDHLVAMAYGILNDNLVVDEHSTALGMVFNLSLPWEACTGMNRGQVAEAIRSNPKFEEFVGYIRNVMQNDPQNLLDFNVHPVLLEAIRAIVDGMVTVKNAKGQNSAYIENCAESPEEVLIRNYKMIPYGISGYDLNGDLSWISSYFFDKKPVFVPSKSLLELVMGEGPTIKYKTGTGDYLLCMSKPDILMLNAAMCASGNPTGCSYTFKEIGDRLFNYLSARPQPLYQDIVRMDALAKATLANTCEVLILVIGAIPEFGPAVSIPYDIALSMANSDDAAQTLAMDVSQASLEEVLYKGIMYYIKNHPEAQKYLAGVILHDKRMTNIVTRKIDKFIPLIPTFLEAMIKYTDWQTADQYVAYKVHKNGSQSDCAQSFPPDNPQVSGYPNSTPYGSTVNVTFKSYDPEGKKIQYQFYVNPYSVKESDWLPSGTSYTFSFTPSTTGLYHMTGYALDEDGAMSGPTHFTMTVTSGQSSFYEGFEAYPVGPFTSNPAWMVDCQDPGKVIIASDGYESAHAAKFLDYDPAGGGTAGPYAYIYTTLDGNPASVEFSLKIDDDNDAYGVRAWQSLGDWNTMAYYVMTSNAKLNWVKYGYDINDPGDFVPFMDMDAGRWYRIKLAVNWLGGTYDIYVDGQLKVAQASFLYNYYGPVAQAPFLQCVAFNDAQCHGATLDEINIAGAKLNQSKSKIPSSPAAAALKRAR